MSEVDQDHKRNAEVELVADRLIVLFNLYQVTSLSSFKLINLSSNDPAAKIWAYRPINLS